VYGHNLKHPLCSPSGTKLQYLPPTAPAAADHIMQDVSEAADHIPADLPTTFIRSAVSSTAAPARTQCRIDLLTPVTQRWRASRCRAQRRVDSGPGSPTLRFAACAAEAVAAGRGY
jgi:hypothetical protein